MSSHTCRRSIIREESKYIHRHRVSTDMYIDKSVQNRAVSGIQCYSMHCIQVVQICIGEGHKVLIAKPVP